MPIHWTNHFSLCGLNHCRLCYTHYAHVLVFDCPNSMSYWKNGAPFSLSYRIFPSFGGLGLISLALRIDGFLFFAANFAKYFPQNNVIVCFLSNLLVSLASLRFIRLMMFSTAVHCYMSLLETDPQEIGLTNNYLHGFSVIDPCSRPSIFTIHPVLRSTQFAYLASVFVSAPLSLVFSLDLASSDRSISSMRPWPGCISRLWSVLGFWSAGMRALFAV